MTNIYQGYGPDEMPDEMPTAPRTVARAGFGGPGEGGPSGNGSGGSGHGGGSGRGGRRRWAAVLAITAVVVGGGTFAAAEVATGSPAAPAALTAAGTQGSATTQAATSTQAKKEAGRRHRLARLRRLGGMYGSYTFETKQGARTVAFERGTIESVAGDDVLVRAHNGTTWRWTLTSKSVVREDGKRSTDSALKSGELVFTGGPVTGSTRDVRLIVIRQATSGTGQPTA